MISENKLLIVGALVAAAVLIHLSNKAVDLAKEGLDAVNPLNPDNVFNKEALREYRNMTGSTGTIGGDLYDFLHPKFPVNVRGLNSFDPSKRETDWEGNPVNTGPAFSGFGS